MGPGSSNGAPRLVALAQGSIGGALHPWVVHEGRALALSDVAHGSPLADAPSIDVLVKSWSRWASDLRRLTDAEETAHDVVRRGIDSDELDLVAPVTPGQTFCTIGNYSRQVVESAVDAGDGPDGPAAAARRADAIASVELRRRDGEPYICLTSSQRVAAARGRLSIPEDVDTLDWEVELAAVIGGVADREAGQHLVAGYCLANDLTIRERVFREDVPSLASDWVQSKGTPGSLPLGPWFVPAWQLPDVSALRLQLFVNDVLMQDDDAGDMIFDVDRQVAYLARHTALQPGDIICTGSPAGFGAHHGRFLRPGDLVRARIAELGEQRIECVAEDASSRRGENMEPERSITDE